MDDKELQEQLVRGPLTRNGFDDSLRKKIHDRIDNPRRRTNRFWSIPASMTSIAISAVLIIILGVWTWNGFNKGNLLKDVQSTNQTSKAVQQSTVPTEEDQTLNSAMLIGLRNDLAGSDKGGPGSTYRTVLVVPQDNELTIAAEGSGIYMPFEQNFWKISAVIDTKARDIQILAAAPVKDNQEAEADPLEQISTSLRISEKLLFAGNRYVSIQQTITMSEEGAPVNESSLWVNEVEQLNRRDSPSILEKQHYTLAEVLEQETAGTDIHEWAITRAQGKWVAKQPSEAARLKVAASVNDLQPISIPLTSKATGVPDTLALEWKDILELEPNARDAFTSSTNDILAVVVENSIDLYPYKLPAEQMKPLTIETAPNESIVMVQWAQGGFIENWKKQLSKWIPPTASPRL